MRGSVPSFLLVIAFATSVSATTTQFPNDIVAEATSRDGAIVTFQLNPGVTCSHRSGFRFPIGVTTVGCTTADNFGGSFKVAVVDSTPPVLHLPDPVVLSAPAVFYFQATASDVVDHNPGVACDPKSGSFFAAGTTTVSCTAGDFHGNRSTATFTVTAPEEPTTTLQLPDDITAEATSRDGATVTFQVSASKSTTSVSVTCSHPSGFRFPIGVTTVTCKADDAGGQFTISVVDTTPPVLHLPDPLVLDAPGRAYFHPTASDIVDHNPRVVCYPPSGSFFYAGTTTVACIAIDFHGNRSTGSFDVTAPPPPPGMLPDDIIAEATGPDGAAVTYTAGTTVTCVPPSGSLFPLGTTAVSCSDASSGAPVGTFLVTVVDTTPPELTLPGDITTDATSSSGAVVTFDALANDLVDGSLTVSCTPPSGSTFAVGTTEVRCTATDTRGNNSSGSFFVTVRDASPFEITVTATPNVLSPPNHKMVPVTVTVTANDGRSFTAYITDIASNEIDDGKTSPDWEITGPLTANLRAERNDPSARREYLITVLATDSTGNQALGTVKVIVANTRRRRAFIASVGNGNDATTIETLSASPNPRPPA